MALGGWRIRKRENAFDHYCTAVKEALNQYIDDPDRKDKNDWKDAAINFRDNTLARLEPTKSLIALHQQVYEFSESLRSTYNYVTSSIFGESFTKTLGSYVGATGSDLKAQLSIILESIQPYHPSYISEELFKIKLRLQREKFYQQIFYYDESKFDYIASFSSEAVQVLSHVMSDDERLSEFKLKARDSMWVVPVQELIDKFKEKLQSEEKTRIRY
tara:strand:- start:41820 stop:42467 length:648 start_codon:yes stop_codon:yes gene_type:complete